MKQRSIKLAAAVLVMFAVVLAVAAPAWAVQVTVRVQGLEREVCPPITVDVPDRLLVTDSYGHEWQCDFANALGAIYLAAKQHSFEFEFVEGWGGVFINSVAGSGGPPYWSSWWMYAVNGCMPMVGASDFELENGDEILLFEASGDPLAPWNTKALVLSGPKVVAAGQSVTLLVRSDDLAKPNSLTEAGRFGLDETDVESPDEFLPVPGAIVHVGDTTYVSDTNGEVHVAAVPLGKWHVWVEKAFDADWQYVAGPGGYEITGQFNDVPPANPFFSAIHNLAAARVVEGFSSGVAPTFGADYTLKRAQLAKMIVLALSLPLETGYVLPFVDLPNTQEPYPNDYIATAFKQGIMQGRSNTHFEPWAEASRAQVVTMVTRAALRFAPDRVLAPPADYRSTWGDFSPDHSPWARIAQYNGLLTGLDLEGSAKNPWGSITRGETAQLLDNLRQLTR